MNTPKLLRNVVPFLAATVLFSCSQDHSIPERVEAPYNDIIERNLYEYNLLKDPTTGKIPAGVTEASYRQAISLPAKEDLFSGTNSPAILNTYTAAGPNNLGGRTRAFAYDVRYDGTTNMVMLAGCTSSGVMRSTDGGASWTLVAGTSNIHDISCIAQDPRAGQQDTWYLGTGEALGNTSGANGAFRLGNGIYKSTNNGLTWSWLPTSNTAVYENFDSQRDLIQRIVVDPTNGNVYAACLSDIIRSTDGGSTWGAVLAGSAGNNSDICDIVCSSTGVLYAGFAGTATIAATNGVWKSTTGASGSWTQIAGNSVPVGWKAAGAYGRIVLALAPSNQNILYAVYDNLLTGSAAPGVDFFQYNAATSTWSANRTANLPTEGSINGTFTTQGGYDLALAVKPDDENFVILGGTNGYKSTTGFSTASFTRIGGYAAPGTNSKYLNHHPDQHIYVFQPGSNIKMVSGDDGGIQLTSDITAGTVAWSSLNNNYQTYQYYYTAIDPTLGSTKYIGGAQDNGTTYRNAGTNTMLEVLTGDGVSVGISSANTFHYCGFQNGDFYRRGSGDPVSTGTYLKPSTETNPGLFVTLFYLNPDNTEDLYYANDNRLWRNTGASTASTTVGAGASQWQQMTGVSAAVGVGAQIMSFATTRGTYTTAHKLYVGTNNAKIWRLDDPRNAAAATAPVDVTPAGITAGSTVIGIAVAPQNDDTVLAVISNYGVPSVFWTGNATSATPTWYNVEGTGVGKLDLPSFRSCAIVAKTTGFEYYVGTSVGLFSTATILGGSQANANLTAWTREGSGVIDQAIVTSLPVRNNDNTMLVGTHGNGMFVANILSALPVTINTFNAARSANQVRVNWNVSSEYNVKQYVVERRYPNEAVFTAVGNVTATSGNGAKIYDFTDNSVVFNKGNIEYRLRVVNIDDKTAYSGIANVRGSISNLVSEVYPTVATSNINITVPVNNSIKKFTISIADNAGRILMNRQYDYQTTSIPVNQLSAGVYYLVISANNEKYVTKFVKQ